MRIVELKIDENDAGWLYRAVNNEKQRNPISDKRHWDKLLERIADAQVALRD